MKKVLAFVLLLAGCASISKRDRELAVVHQNIAQESIASGDGRTALAEVEKGLALDPQNQELHNLHGLLLHLWFGKPEEAVAAYRRSLKLAPDASAVKVNLGAALTALDRCAEAVPLLEEARRDMLYREPYLAENNLGWCRYKLGDVESGIGHLRAAINLNRKFCLGYSNLATIFEEQGRTSDAGDALERYATICPEVADAHRRRALFRLKQGDLPGAREGFVACRDRAREGDVAEDCARQAALIPEG